MPTGIGRMVGSGQAAVGMGMAITGWTGGYLMGSPIAGYLIAATGADRSDSAEPYKSCYLLCERHRIVFRCIRACGKMKDG